MSKILIIKQKVEKTEKKPCEDENKCIFNKSNYFETNNINIDHRSLDDCFSYKDNFYKKGSIKDIIYINTNTNINDFIDDKDEENNEIKTILSDLNKSIIFNIQEKENKNSKECQEIINIMKIPINDIKNSKNLSSPFKPLLKPKKISMTGKIIYNTYKNINSNEINNDISKSYNNKDNDVNDKN